VCNLADPFDLAKLIGHQRGQVHIPWLAQDQEDFIHGDYRPELITIAEPTRMRLGEKKTLIEFWLKRQNDASVEHAFLFRAYPSGDDWISHEYSTKRISGKQDSSGRKDKEKPKQRNSNNTQSRKVRRISPPSSETSSNEGSDPQDEDEDNMDGEDHRPGSRAVGDLVVATRKGKEKALGPSKKDARKPMPERNVADDEADEAECPPMPDKGQSSKHWARGSPEEDSEDGDGSTGKALRSAHPRLTRGTLHRTTSSSGSRPLHTDTTEKSMGEPEWGRQPPTLERLKTAGRSVEMARQEVTRQGVCVPEQVSMTRLTC
jgi:hypothetical protein